MDQHTPEYWQQRAKFSRQGAEIMRMLLANGLKGRERWVVEDAIGTATSVEDLPPDVRAMVEPILETMPPL